MLNAIARFIRDEEGATAIEYGLIAGLIAAVLVAVLTGLGTQIKAKFNEILVAIGGTAA
ncbi:Flp family type IVb pilin [Variovorax sp. UC122_21]|uniref:Flp family type IVb pilin n=1 Tax=Variovorax sp. UC122_21 TaxID=3374554 RepID=UPI0037576161